MMRTWRMFVLPALVTTTLAVASARAGDAKPDDNKAKTLAEQLKSLQDQIANSFGEVGKDVTGLKQELKTLKDDQVDGNLKVNRALDKVANLELAIDGLKTEIATLRRRLPDVRLYPETSDKAALEDIRARLAQIEIALGRLQERGRTSLSSPQSGRIVFVNTTAEELTFIVNGRPYRVTPGMRVPLEGHPVGRFSYEVISPSWGLRGQNTRTLEPGETFTITASPP